MSTSSATTTLPTQPLHPSTTHLVSSIGSATSSTQGCLNRLRNPASFFSTSNALSSLRGSLAPLRDPPEPELRWLLSHVQIETCLPLVLCTARSTFHTPIWTGPILAELELGADELGREVWTLRRARLSGATSFS